MAKINDTQKTLLIILASQADALSANDIHDACKEDLPPLMRVSAELSLLRGKGLVENGENEVVNNRTRLTWSITDQGRTMVEQARNDSAESIEVEVLDEMPSDLMDMRTPPMGTHHIDIEAVKRELTETLERHFGPAEQPEIDDIGLKIDTLERLAPMLSPDINDVLLAIADDLKQLNAA